MTGKYALFLWGSYLLTLIVLLWNALGPMFRRQALKRQLAETVDEDAKESAKESEVQA